MKKNPSILKVLSYNGAVDILFSINNGRNTFSDFVYLRINPGDEDEQDYEV